MRTVLLAIVWILALNLLAAVVLAIAEVHARRKIRREIDALEQLWHLDPRGRGSARGTWFAGRTAVAATAMLVLSGVAWATPATREFVVATVQDVVRDRSSEPSGERANEAPSRTSTAPPESAPTTSASVAGGGAGSAQTAGSEGPETRTGDDVAAAEADASAPPSTPGETSSPPPTTSAPAPSPSPVPTEQPSTPPAVVPFTASATVTSATTVDVAWSAVPTATGFFIERTSDGGLSWLAVAQVGPDARSVTSSSLEPGTSYTFRVHATMLSGTEQIADVDVTTLPGPIAGPLEVPSLSGSATPAA